MKTPQNHHEGPVFTPERISKQEGLNAAIAEMEWFNPDVSWRMTKQSPVHRHYRLVMT